MNSPEADSSPVFETDDATTESTLIDHIACVTETSDISKAEAKDDDGINQLLNRAAKLTVSEEPKAMDAAYDCAAAIAAKVAASPKGTSGEMRRAFEELLTANSEMLHRKAR